jgi:hypothetical protein
MERIAGGVKRHRGELEYHGAVDRVVGEESEEELIKRAEQMKLNDSGGYHV